MTRPEWIQSIGYGIAALVAIFTIFSYFYTQKKQHSLDVVKFSLDQHRRLFDDEVLFEILNLIDAPEDEQRNLDEPSMGNKKRKLITFFEEMVLLVREGYMSEDFAVYMFGYYALQARDNKYFMSGISTDYADFGIFFDFADRYAQRKGLIDVKKICITSKHKH
ncbi:hypothetical protein DFP86_1023 [Paludibacterium purpuratum]|uniref:DUF4760 domain-containing protein n=2 Tax=Paludibacterium purpuratum TaxID=1144873 RepID=A0A4R7BB78_9NEIS|nr:hypothetical protein DFP86_1023 [Paludibacterium purpuratum]